MGIFNKIDLLIYSFLLLLFLLIYYSLNASKKELSTRLFIGVLVTLMIMNLLAALAWVPNLIDAPWAWSMNYWSNAVYLACNFVPLIAWLAYLDFKILGDEEGLKKRIWLYLIPFYITVVMIIVNHFTGWVFTIEAGNSYTRQIGVYIIGALVYVMLLVLFIISRKQKKNINGRTLQVIFWFFALPIIGGILQLRFFGLSLTWPMFTFATVMAFVLIEKETMIKDALTNLPTRGQLELRIKHKLRRGEPFSLIMIDLDRFKEINDKFGHDEGDETLMTVSSILEQSVKRHDMVCRYGGDEFMMLIESDLPGAGQSVRQRIESGIKAFNGKKVKPYEIGMSFGVIFVGEPKSVGLTSILSEVDGRMYADKESKK